MKYSVSKSQCSRSVTAWRNWKCSGYVRSEQKNDSDLDILVTVKEAPSLLTFIAIENYLSDLLGIKVDLVMKDSLKPKIGQQILRESITV
ncbi:MAG: nucleotidyltransferase family protein [Anaerolineales bacterium]